MKTKKISDSKVLDIAFTVISREGFDSFTLAQVSKATTLSPAALIKRFKTKRNLALLARNRRWDENLAIHKESMNYPQTGLEGLYKMVERIANSVDSRRLGEHARWLGTESLSLQSKKKVSLYFERTRSILQKHIEEAQNLNEIKRTVSSVDLALNLEAFIQGVIFQYIFITPQQGILDTLVTRVTFFISPFQTK